MKATRPKSILVDDHGDGVWRVVEVYRRRTPAGPDPDRAEMLLAEDLANRALDLFAGCVGGAHHRIAADVSGAHLVMCGGVWLCDESPVASGAYDGAHGCVTTSGDPDAYVAGAALAMILENA